MANKHAVLSASSSERWLNCPPSARLCENYEDKGSDYASEGTDAHTLCEFRLKQALGVPTEDPTDNLSWYNEEMDECAAGYAAYVVELLETAKQTCTDPVVMIEQRVNFLALGQGIRLDFRHLGWYLQLLWHQLAFQRNGLGILHSWSVCVFATLSPFGTPPLG